jgi:chorismate lyase/3-hydroxybenzoate synthase
LAVAGAGAGGAHAAPRYVDATSAQCSATAYGSAFARAAWVTFGGAAALHLSGTAAIDRAGRTVAIGDREGQVRATLESVAALLAAQGLTLADLVSVTAYVKDAETERAMERYLARAGLGAAILAVPVDLCRTDLLFEIEGVAVAPTLPSGSRPSGSRR